MSTFPSSPDRVVCSPPSEFRDASADEFALVGESAAIKRLRLQIARVGPHFRTALIRGEAGTEKEQVARRLHSLGQGRGGQFVACRAGSLEDSTSSNSSEASLDWLARMAGGGTIFVDGVEEMSPNAQAGLLRILRRYEGAGQGGDGPPRLDLRVIAATSEELRVLACAGRFVDELYRSLATVEIAVPALRDRMEDLPELVKDRVDRLAARHGCDVSGLSKEAIERLEGHRWSGNMYELEDVLRDALLQCESGVIEVHHLRVPEDRVAGLVRREAERSVRLQDVVERHVMRVLKDCGGNKLRAAERLGISRSTLYRMLDAGAVAHGLR